MKTRFNFSEQTLERLRQANWHHGYGQDTSEYERILRKNGYPVFPCVREFLHFFGGMRLFYPHSIAETDTQLLNTSVSDGNYAALFRDYMTLASETLGSNLCFIGRCYDADWLMAMSEDGKVYGLDEDIFLLGESGQDAIEGICANRNVESIGVLDMDRLRKL